MTERQEYIKFIKERYPIGTVIWVDSCSQPYTITKRTVFRVHPWSANDYNDHFRPEHDKDYHVDFSCHDAGKNTRDYNLSSYEKKDILSKYKKPFIDIQFDKEVDVVTLDTAKQLKENGFNLPTHHYYMMGDFPYVTKGLKRVYEGRKRVNHNKYNSFIYSAPTREQVKKWLLRAPVLYSYLGLIK